MNKIIPFVVVVLLFTATARADTVIPAEVATPVELSNHDINRIVCPGPMTDLIFSREKGLTGHFSGNNAFIKFKIEKNGDEYVYTTTPNELFVVCNGAVYTLIATPRDIPSVTLRLASAKGKRFKHNIARYRKMPLEKQALQLIREAYAGSCPSSYRITPASGKSSLSLSPHLETTLQRTIDVEGVGLRLKQYRVKALGIKPVAVDETMFLTSAVSPSILAVAVEDHTLNRGASIRVFVVEKKETPR